MGMVQVHSALITAEHAQPPRPTVASCYAVSQCVVLVSICSRNRRTTLCPSLVCMISWMYDGTDEFRVRLVVDTCTTRAEPTPRLTATYSPPRPSVHLRISLILISSVRALAGCHFSIRPPYVATTLYKHPSVPDAILLSSSDATSFCPP